VSGDQAFFEWCFVVTPGACSKIDPTLPPLGFFGVVFLGFLASRPDRFCPFAIVTSHEDWPWMMTRSSQRETNQNLRTTQKKHGKASRDPPGTRVHSRAQKRSVLSPLEEKSFSSKEE
jgi:hypothetical protein